MNFRIQEVIKMLVPGSVLLISLYLFFFKLNDLDGLLKKDYVVLYVVLLLAIVYVAGYFVDWFGSLFERTYYKIFAKPSFKLLNNLAKNKKYGIKMLKYEEIGENLCIKLKVSSQSPYDKENAERLFKAANYLKDQNTNLTVKERLTEFYFYSIFSRNLAASFLSAFLLYPFLYLLNNCGIFQIYNQPNDWSGFNLHFIFSLLLSILCIFRWREHAAYYTRYIFYAANPDILKI